MKTRTSLRWRNRTFAFAAFACLLLLFSTSPAGAASASFCSNDAQCDDGQFCTLERCQTTSSGKFCVRDNTPRCQVGTECREATDSCVILPPCMLDVDCQDGVFCNGVERCMPGSGADSRGCRPPSGVRCTADQICNEQAGRCDPLCSDDFDGDGTVSRSCGGSDCDDSDINRFPGATETCSASNPNHDEDCDENTFGNVDVDEDGHVASLCCNLQQSSGSLACGPDCNDNEPTVNADSPEVCDGVDNDCNGDIDEGVQVDLFTDQDGDNHGTPSPPTLGCPGEAGMATIDNDCDDTNPAIQPGAIVCDPALGPGGVRECASNGALTQLFTCAAGEVCVPQPNGTGACVLPQQ